MNKNKKLVRLFTPSWVVNVVAVSLALLVPTLVIVLTYYQVSDLKLQVINARGQVNAGSTHALYQTAANNLAGNRLLATAPLFIVWACVGLGVYYLTISVVRAFGEVAELREELDYVHVSRRNLVRQAVLHFVARVAVALGWFGFIQLTVHALVPYVLALASIAASDVSLRSVAYALFSGLIIYITACAHAVFMRLIFLRHRLLT